MSELTNEQIASNIYTEMCSTWVDPNVSRITDEEMVEWANDDMDLIIKALDAKDERIRELEKMVEKRSNTIGVNSITIDNLKFRVKSNNEWAVRELNERKSLESEITSLKEENERLKGWKKGESDA